MSMSMTMSLASESVRERQVDLPSVRSLQVVGFFFSVFIARRLFSIRVIPKSAEKQSTEDRPKAMVRARELEHDDTVEVVEEPAIIKPNARPRLSRSP